MAREENEGRNGKGNFDGKKAVERDFSGHSKSRAKNRNRFKKLHTIKTHNILLLFIIKIYKNHKKIAIKFLKILRF